MVCANIDYDLQMICMDTNREWWWRHNMETFSASFFLQKGTVMRTFSISLLLSLTRCWMIPMNPNRFICDTYSERFGYSDAVSLRIYFDWSPIRAYWERDVGVVSKFEVYPRASGCIQDFIISAQWPILMTVFASPFKFYGHFILPLSKFW